MKTAAPAVLSAAALIACCAALVLYRRSAAPSWKGYRVLYVSRAFPEDAVLALCRESGVDGVVSLSRQMSAARSPYRAVRRSAEEYGRRRENFFFDKTRSYQLFYIEDAYGAKLPALAGRIMKAGAGACGVDAPAGGGAGFGGSAAAFLAAFALFAAFARPRARGAVLAGGAPAALFAWRAGGPAAAAAASLALYSLFVLSQAWGARGLVRAWLAKPPALLALAASFAAAAAGGAAAFALFALTASAAAGALFLLAAAESRAARRRAFSPVRILPARAAPLVTKKTLLFAFAPAAVTAVCVCMSVFSPDAGAGDAGGLLFPAPAFPAPEAGFSPDAYRAFASASAARAGEFPTLADWVSIAWEAEVFPYRRLEAERAGGAAAGRAPFPLPVPAGETAAFPEYQAGAAGIIETETVRTFDESFISGIIAAVTFAEPPRVERVLARQGRFTGADYRGGGGAGGVPPVFLFPAGLLPAVLAALRLKGKKCDDWSA